VREEAQAGWTCSYPNVAADLAVKPVVSTACWYEETFTSGVTERNNDFGNWTPASKTGMKFEDLDADGVKDGTEAGPRRLDHLRRLRRGRRQG